MSYDLPLCVTWRQIKHTIFVLIDLKIGTHIDWTYTMYIAKIGIDQNNVTYVSIATKYPIIKNMAFFKN